MKQNMGIIDRVIRILIAAVIVALFFAKVISGILAIILLIVAGIFVLTSLISFCPLYRPFGLSSRKKEYYRGFRILLSSCREEIIL